MLGEDGRVGLIDVSVAGSGEVSKDPGRDRSIGCTALGSCSCLSETRAAERVTGLDAR
jgi:hypothetical protein